MLSNIRHDCSDHGCVGLTIMKASWQVRSEPDVFNLSLKNLVGVSKQPTVPS
jgi:hypothetical protein